MKSLKKVIYEYKYRKIRNKFEMLEAYLENEDEARACLGNEYIEGKYYNKYLKRCNKVYEKLGLIEKKLEE